MLNNLIQADIPLIFVETDEPQRVDFPETDHDFRAVWDKRGITYWIGAERSKIPSTTTMEAALNYLSVTTKKYFIVLYGEPDYDLLKNISDKHTLVFVNAEFREYVGAVKVGLSLSEKADYLKAFKAKTKFAKDCAEKAVGMKIKDAVNCYKYSKYMQTDFITNKKLFTKSSYLDIVESKNTFKDLGGFEEFKEWFDEIKVWYTIGAKEFGFPRQKGVLLYGPSGVGKSLCASCLGNEAGLPLYKFDFTKVYDQYVGESESRIRQALKDIEKTAPSIIWIEEIGRLFAGEDIQSNIAHHQVLAILLEWMQEHDKDIFIVATANGVKNIPKELIRPGRFSKNYLAEMPNKETREKIFDIYLNKIGIEYDSNILAEQKRTGAEIEAKVQEIVIEAYNKKVAKESILNRLIKGE